MSMSWQHIASRSLTQKAFCHAFEMVVDLAAEERCRRTGMDLGALRLQMFNDDKQNGLSLQRNTSFNDICEAIAKSIADAEAKVLAKNAAKAEP